MELDMEGMDVNWLAVLAATLIGFVIGFLWYGPLFGKQWMAASGMTEEKAQQGNMAKIFGFSFIFQALMAVCLAFFLADPSIGLQEGAYYGFLTGFGWVAPAIAITSLFEQRSWSYISIHASYWIVVFTLMGLILGAWK
ncbi:DUF1761 domain-containing protein [Balneola sp. MJW-20]|uniref:DUF1761 domain-containing protein n=1 Tax=Gracilimonas aurantiaca TaxID=3234185 RepID=UPI003466C5AD